MSVDVLGPEWNALGERMDAARKESKTLRDEIKRLRSGSEIHALRTMVSAQAEIIASSEALSAAAATHDRPLRDYDLEERVERLETLLSCVRIVGGNELVADFRPELARRILTEICRDVHEAEDAQAPSASQGDGSGEARRLATGASGAESQGTDLVGSRGVVFPGQPLLRETASCFLHGDFDPTLRRCPTCVSGGEA